MRTAITPVREGAEFAGRIFPRRCHGPPPAGLACCRGFFAVKISIHAKPQIADCLARAQPLRNSTPVLGRIEARPPSAPPCFVTHNPAIMPWLGAWPVSIFPAGPVRGFCTIKPGPLGLLAGYAPGRQRPGPWQRARTRSMADPNLVWTSGSDLPVREKS